MAHFVAFFISFQKIIPSKIPPGGGTGVIGGSRTTCSASQELNHSATAAPLSILKQIDTLKHRIYINTCRYSWEKKDMIIMYEQEDLKKYFTCKLRRAKRAEVFFFLNWPLYPSNFQFKIHRTRNSRTANLNFKEGHPISRTFQGQIHFQGVLKENPKLKEFSRTVGTLDSMDVMTYLGTIWVPSSCCCRQTACSRTPPAHTSRCRSCRTGSRRTVPHRGATTEESHIPYIL